MKSIFSRLILSFIAIILVVIFFISIFFSGLLRNYIIRQKERDLESKGKQIVELSRRFINSNMDENTFSYMLNSIDEVVNSQTIIVNVSGIVMNSPLKGKSPGPRFPGKGMKFNDSDMQRILSGSIVVKNGYNPFFNEPMITVGMPIYADNGNTNIIGAVILNSPVTGVAEAINSTNVILVFSSVAALTLSLLAAYFLSKTLSKPIHTISKAALEIAEGNYFKSVNITRKDEIGSLASAFNYLTQKLSSTISDLNNEKSKLSNVLYSMEEGLIALDNGLNIIHMNPAALQLLNMENSPDAALSDLPCSEDIMKNVTDVLHNGSSKSYDLNISESKVISTLMSPLKYQSGEIYGAIILLLDVSESVKLEKMRRDFIANVSHELRTPLTSIRGFIEPLIDGTVDDDKTRLKYSKIIRDETLRLERLINDLLDLSRLQSGKVILDIQKVDITELISNVINRFQPLMNSKGIEFIFTGPTSHVFIEADGDRIEQLMVIFIDNALKFTSQGGKIEIGIAEDGELVRIWIKDSGAGIPEEDIPYIWERFYKVDKSRTGKNTGTGLGLSIAKNIIELHNQKVSVKSKLGEGTVFEFTMKRCM